jgi:alanine dehydrogenase
MTIGIPKEIKKDEFRVAMTPTGVAELTKKGHKVVVEAGAGAGSGFDDAMYRDSGAVLVDGIKKVYAEADLIVKVKEPIEPEFELLKEEQLLFTYLHLAAAKSLTEVLLEKRVRAFAYETLDRGGRLPLLEPMSEIAGKMASLFGAVHLGRYSGGSGRLLGGAVGVERNRVVVLGGGVAGKAAAEAAAGFGADVVILDISQERLRYLHDTMPSNVATRYSTKKSIEELLPDADLVVGTVLLPGEKAPKLVTREMLGLMRPGSVLVDVSIDQGGCFETSRATTHSEPTFAVDGIVHYCVANMPGAYPRTSTMALSSATLPYIVALAEHGPAGAIERIPGMHGALNTYLGKLTNKAVADAHGMNYEPY